jgi:hypothetical protein
VTKIFGYTILNLNEFCFVFYHSVSTGIILVKIVEKNDELEEENEKQEQSLQK